jgi:GR25 family glycosyltransferase involved in LPS biosynthesis
MSEGLEITRLGQALPKGCGVCVINLDHRHDRWAEFQSAMMPHLAPLEVHRISAVEGVGLPGFGDPPYFRGRPRDRTWGARAGCTLSHRAALAHARDAGWSHVLVLEDDIHLPQAPAADMLEALHEVLEKTGNDICYLGFTDPVPPFRELARLGSSHALHQVFGCNTAHAYLVSRHAMDRMLALLPEPHDIWRWLTRHRAVDRFYYRNLSPALTVTAVSPALIGQKAGFSDIIGKPVAAYSESHLTAIEASHPQPERYANDLARRAAAFARDARIDRLRGWWKSLRGF